jgi:hypothetical protein
MLSEAEAETKNKPNIPMSTPEESYKQKVTGFAEDLHRPFILADWYTLWWAILRDLPHPNPSQRLETETFKWLPRWHQVKELLEVSHPYMF